MNREPDNTSPENLAAEETEIVMLRSELAELLQTHADKTAIHQSDDWDQPTEIILAGTCHHTDSEGRPKISDVHVRQRLDQNGTDYLIITGDPGNFYWLQITDSNAQSIFLGETPLSADDVAIIRLLVRPGTTEWSTEDTQRWAKIENIYETADRYARRV
jgi:hypothetical protein